MLNKKIYTLAFLLLLSCNTVTAQFYRTGEAPWRVRWNQIKSENYTVIYPQGIDSLAQRYTWLLESERERVMAGVIADPKRIPIVLQPYTTVSNGMVVWAPKRAEFYTRPPADGAYYQNWERQLVLHESRHIGQMSHFTKGVYKPLSWLFGEQITGLGVGIYAAKWLLEGDAVIAETELTNGGRGRSASFLEYYRASFLSGEYRNWNKWRHGGYKKYTPDMYAFGYIINSTARVKSGNYLYTGELLDLYVRKFYDVDIVDRASLKAAGAAPKELFKDGVEMYTKLWREDFERRAPHTDMKAVQHNGGRYHYEYTSPVVVGKDSVICLKSSFDNPAALVMLCSGEEFMKKHRNGEKLLRAFSSSASDLALAGDKLYWTESVADIRWGHESFNNLYSYDLKSGKIKALSKGSSYNNPAVTSSGDTLTVVEYPVEGGSNMVFLTPDGSRIASYRAPENGQLTECAWIGSKVYALAITETGLGMFVMDMEQPGVWQCVMEGQPKAIRSLRSTGSVLYFESDMDGVNNIYLFNPETEELKRIVNSRFGAHDPYIHEDKVYWSDLDTDGMKPVSTVIDSVCVKRSDDVLVKDRRLLNGYKYEIADKLSEQAERYFETKGSGRELSGTPASGREYEKGRYRKGSHLFRFHSWAPIYYNVDKIMDMSYDHFYDLISVGAAAYSQNTLGTAVTMLGYSYRKGYHAAHASFEYSGLFPIFKIEADYNTANRYDLKIDNNGKQMTVNVNYTNKPLFNLSALVYLPLNLSSHGWQRGLVPQIVWKYENNGYYNAEHGGYVNRQQVNYALQYYQMRPVAHAAIFPKWGFNATVKGAFSPGSGENFGSALSVYSYMYFPGLMRRQGIRLSASYQKQYVENKYMYLSNLVDMPRGHDEHYGTDYFKLSADYAVPVNLNGISLGFLAYLKRLQIIPFVDIAGVKRGTSGYMGLYSYGGDILVDTIVFNIGVPISLGVRYARTNDAKQPNYIGFLGNISLF